MLKKTDPTEMTEASKAAIQAATRSGRIPKHVRDLLPHNLDTLKTETAAFRDVAEYLAWKAQMLRSARQVQSATDEAAIVEELQRQLTIAEQTIEAERVARQREINGAARAAAIPAQVVHSDD